MTAKEMELLQHQLRAVRDSMYTLGMQNSEEYHDIYQKICTMIVNLSDMIDSEEDKENGTEK